MSNISNPRAETLYGFPQPIQKQTPPPILAKRAPTGNDTGYNVGQSWIYVGNGGYELISVSQGVANWQPTSGSGSVQSIIGTANEITASSSTGNVTLSIPTAFQAPGSITAATSITATNGNIVLGTAGNKLSIATGANASVGTTAAMTGSPGAVTVSTTACTTSSKIIYSRATTGGTEGNVSITAQSAGSFTLTSTGNETSTFNYLIIN